MDPRVARKIAKCGHSGQRNRFAEPVIEHAARVSAAVPPWARAVAWLHDPGRIARAVKVAGLDDHLAHRWLPPDAPPYAWARRYLFRLNVERSLPLAWKRASIAQDHVG